MPKSPSKRLSRNEKIWSGNLTEESSFWLRWLTEDEFSEDRALRLNSNRPLPDSLVDRLDPDREVYNILDVGSGPASPIGATMPGKHVNLILIDPLATEYKKMLDDLGLFNLLRPLPVRGENLLEFFPESYFDIVSCNNALDHCADPLTVIKQMIGVCRHGGWVVISSFFNVGVMENYYGLHQWNLDIREGRFVIWNPNSFVDVLSVVDNVGGLEVETSAGDYPEMCLWILVDKRNTLK